MNFSTKILSASFHHFNLESCSPRPEALAVPTARSSRFSRSGSHAYYFYNFSKNKGVCVEVSHGSLIMPGLSRFAKANPSNFRFLPRVQALFAKYHYGFNFLEQIMLLTVPHSIVSIGEGRFIVSLWAYYGYLLVDLNLQTVTYYLLDNEDDDSVLGSTQWFDPSSKQRFFMTYSLKDSLMKTRDPHFPVSSRVYCSDEASGRTTEIWSGKYSDYMHEIIVSKDSKQIVICDVGRFLDRDGKLIPSKVLVLNREGGNDWMGSCVENGAHAQFDPDDQSLVYFSHHNFLFVHTRLVDLLKKGSYTVDFRGPAAVYRYRLESSGPVQNGCFADPEMFRLTNNHCFYHRGQKILAAMGAPAFVYIADAESMHLQRRLELSNPTKSVPCYIGTFTPSFDGEKLYVQTTRSFQVIDVQSGACDLVLESPLNHLCSNHSITSADISW